MKERILKFFPARKFFSFFSNDMAIDLGTANTVVFTPSRGIVLNEPSVVAVKAHTNQVLAVGRKAKEMLGKTPENIIASRPLRDGVIADFDLTGHMLRHFIQTVHDDRRRFIRARPRMIIGVPSGITQVERRAVKDSALQAGAREVYTIPEPMAAAIGAGLPVHEPSGSMIVDIGGGTTEVAVISLISGVFCRSVRVGGDEMDRAIVQYVKRKYNLFIGERTAELIKMHIGYALLEDNASRQQTMLVKGRDLVSGVPKTVELTASEVNEALLETIASIIDAVRVALENTPPELSSDLVDKGIVMAGGGSLLKGLDKLISKDTGLPVRVAEDPLFCVVRGIGKVIEDLDFFKDALVE
jgi:rod shape-determining protein MreB